MLRPEIPPWATPDWGGRPHGPIHPDRIRALLAAKPPSPTNALKWSGVFSDYIYSLQEAARHATPQLRAACEVAKAAALEVRREAEDRARDRARAHVDEDWQAALQCEMRAPTVRGLTAWECNQRRVCFLCGKFPIPARRQHWCSDACVIRWTENHEWTAARHATVRRDRACVTCGAASGLEVNHKDPRIGRGYHKGCHNHLDRLEAMCHGDHVKVTAQQAAARRRSGVR